MARDPKTFPTITIRSGGMVDRSPGEPIKGAHLRRPASVANLTTEEALLAIEGDSGCSRWDHPALMDSVQPGACMDRDCAAVTDSHEPDARANWCPVCEGNTVRSLSVLLGIN